MKNFLERWRELNPCVKKLWLIMRLSSLLILLAVFSSTASVYSQATKLTLKMENARIADVFDAIEQQSEFYFFYNRDNFNDEREVSVDFKNKRVEEILQEIFEKENVAYEILDRNILIKIPKTSTSISQNSVQQQPAVSGTVTDESGEPLPGVTVVVKGTTQGTVSNADGEFSLSNIPEDATLQFSFVGMKPQEVEVGNQSSIDVTMVVDAIGIEEVVAVGYGSLNRKNLTGSISKITSNFIEDLPDINFQNKLAGKLAGVNVSQTTGTPGGNVSISIRGTGSISAGNDPLIVIDGFPISDGQNTSSVQGSRPGNGPRQENPQNSLSTLNPNDIQSVEVLKDAAAAAIYGSRGSNGVILITTKKGAEGKPIFSFNTSWGSQHVSKMYDMMDAYEFAKQNFISRKNGGSLSGYLQEWYPYLNGQPELTSTDWQDALFRTAFMENYNLSVRGGNNSTRYYVSGNYANQDGIILGSGYKRFGLRVNLDIDLNERLKFGINMSPSLILNDLVPSENPYFVDGVVNLALLSIPTEPIYNEDGSYNFNQNTATGSGPFVNPIALANGIDDELKQTRFIIGTHLEYEILKNLKFRTHLGLDFNNWNRAYYRPSWIPVRGTEAPSNPTARNFSTQEYNWIVENTLTYDKLYNEKHHLNVLVGYTAQKDLRERNGLYATDFPNDFVHTLNAGEITSGFSAISEWSLLSYLSRASYDYQGKYLVSASIRRDGSSRFGKNTKWGYFPSISAGWRISDEKFFKSKIINDLKLRASYGKTGNFSISNYGAIALLEGADYILNDKKVNGIAPATSPNADLSWEKNSVYNFGLDLGLFQDKLSLNADYYISQTKDLLLNLPVPGSSGFSNSLQNIGKIENKGLELSVTNYASIGKVKIVTTANIATNKNKVLSTGRNNAPIIANGGIESTHISKVGEPLGSYYGYNVLGVYITQKQLDKFPHHADAELGDFIFEDINNDGVINSDDRTILGDFFPDYTFGFTSQLSFKNIDFSIGIQGKQNFEVLHLAQRYLGSLQTFSNYRADIFENSYISAGNPGNGKVYRPNSSPTNDNDALSSYHIEDGSYVRIQNITVGYSFSKSVLRKVGNLEKLRIYATAENPITFTKYPGYNPDVNQRPNSALTPGEDYGTYPLSRNFIVGINVSF
jgi:TonB-linked SusC/RagA family outer membrane protein